MKYPDYLLIKDLPSYPKGCIFTIDDNNYIYYIKYDPSKIDWLLLPFQKPDLRSPSEKSLLRFNLYQMQNNPDWFLEIDEQVSRDFKIDELIA